VPGHSFRGQSLDSQPCSDGVTKAINDATQRAFSPLLPFVRSHFQPRILAASTPLYLESSPHAQSRTGIVRFVSISLLGRAQTLTGPVWHMNMCYSPPSVSIIDYCSVLYQSISFESALLVYDTLLIFPSEFELVWRGKFRLAAALYHMARYPAMLWMLITIVADNSNDTLQVLISSPMAHCSC
jgi:hypothetical protein